MATVAMTAYRSTIGRKAVMAVTGLLLFGFVVVHMIGNLKIFTGAGALRRVRRVAARARRARARRRAAALDRCAPVLLVARRCCTSGAAWLADPDEPRGAARSATRSSERVDVDLRLAHDALGRRHHRCSSSSTTCCTSRPATVHPDFVPGRRLPQRRHRLRASGASSAFYIVAMLRARAAPLPRRCGACSRRSARPPALHTAGAAASRTSSPWSSRLGNISIPRRRARRRRAA